MLLNILQCTGLPDTELQSNNIPHMVNEKPQVNKIEVPWVDTDKTPLKLPHLMSKTHLQALL